MNKLIIFVLIIFSYKVYGKENLYDNFAFVSFDAVQKELVIDQSLPVKLNHYLKIWFDNRVRVNGFTGEVELKISEFKQKITNMKNGKRVDTSMFFEVYLYENSTDFIKKKGEVSAFGEISGSFSLNEFDDLIENTYLNLVSTLSVELKKKI